MAGLSALIDVYNPLAKKDEPQDMVCEPADETTTSGVEVHPSDHMVSLPFLSVKTISFVKLPMQSWRDSEEVTALSNFLKGPSGRGIQMVVENDGFRLRFNPGLHPGRDPQGWQAAVEASTLLLDALDDLIELKDLGLLSP